MKHYQQDCGQIEAVVEIIITRAAREGIPINVLARILGYRREKLTRHIKQAFNEGKIFQIPPDDWPENDALLAPSSEVIYRGYADQDVAKACNVFGLRIGEGCILVALMRRHGQFFSSKELFRSAAKDRDRTGGNLVSVTICRLRKKLRPFGIMVSRKTGAGYMITHDQANLVQSLLKEKS
jgi:hypothetical protein